MEVINKINDYNFPLDSLLISLENYASFVTDSEYTQGTSHLQL